jgi:hypothetical protein
VTIQTLKDPAVLLFFYSIPKWLNSFLLNRFGYLTGGFISSKHTGHSSSDTEKVSIIVVSAKWRVSGDEYFC